MPVHTIPDEVLHACDDALLQALNCLVYQAAGQIWIVAETLPIASASCDSAEWANNGSKDYVNALTLELGAHVVRARVGKCFIPASAA